MPPPILEACRRRSGGGTSGSATGRCSSPSPRSRLLGILFVAFTNYLFAGDQRVVRVTMVQDAGQPAREALKQACGDLPGVTPVPDRGDPDPRIQGRFPVRFDVSDSTNEQYAALAGCINEQDEVLGFITENDGN